MSIMNKDSIGASFEAIKMMNDISGNLSADDLEERLNTQLTLCFEELAEAITEFEAGNSLGFLKEIVDLWVVVVGLLQVAEAAGFDVEAAQRCVDSNNLSKFPMTVPNSANLPSETHRVIFNEKHQRYVIKRKDGKFLKPAGYKKVDLTGLDAKAIPFVR